MSRDSQRSLVYSAESQVAFILEAGGTIEHFGSTLNVPDERKFGNVESVAAYIEKVLAYSPVAAYPRAKVPVHVRERRGQARAHYEYRTATIAIPPHLPGEGGRRAWALREMVVLHELAHHLVGPGATGGGHGPEFAATLVDLFTHVIDPVAGHLLRVSLYEAGAEIGRLPHTCTA